MRFNVAPAVWVCLFVGPWCPAQPTPPSDAGPAFRALGDSNEVRDDARIRSDLAAAALRLNLHPERQTFTAGVAAPAPGLPPAASAAMTDMFDEEIARLEARLAAVPDRRKAQRDELTNALNAAKKAKADALGQSTPAATAPTAAAPLKRPQPVQANLAADAAVADLKRLVIDNAPPAALAGFAASDDYRSPGRAAKSAGVAMVQNKPVAAVAALLRAVELAPDDPTHLANLAGVANRLALPHHALSLLAAAETKTKPLQTGGGLDARTVIFANRGHALVQLNQPADAERVLRQAVAIDPTLAEARQTLAAALWMQNDPKKKDEAVAIARGVRRRATVTSVDQVRVAALPAKPSGAGEFTLAKLQAVAAAGRRGRPASAATVFRTSGGREATMPTIKIPRRIADGAELHPKIRAFRDELRGRIAAIGKRADAVNDLIRQRERAGGVPPVLAQRHRDLMNYIAHPEWEPSLMAAYMDQYKAGTQRDIGTYGGQHENPWADKALQKREDEIWAAHLGPEATAAAMHEANEPVHGKWQGPIQNYATALGQWLKVKYRYQTALASTISDPLFHEDATLVIELQAIGTAMDLVHVLDVVSDHDRHFVELFGSGPGGRGEAEAPVPGVTPPAARCGAGMTGEYTAAVGVAPIEISGNCDKIAVEISAGEWVKAFGEIEYTFDSGEISLFIGGAGEVGLPGTPVTSGAKAGAYVTVNSKGEFVDVGIKTTRSSGVEIGVIVGSVAYEREIESPISLIAAFSD